MIVVSKVKNHHISTCGLFDYDYRVATFSKVQLTVTEIIMQSFELIESFYHA